MNLKVENEAAATAEAVEVLMERLPASKVARLLASWQIGQGDYVRLRDELFAGETVESLFEATGKLGQWARAGEPDHQRPKPRRRNQ